MHSNSLIIILFVSLHLASCQTKAPIQSFKKANDVTKLNNEEKTLWNEAEKIDVILGKNDSIFTDNQSTLYVQSIIDKVYPEFKGKMKVKILNDPSLNAFALPNGSMYFNLGLLARLDNEAQLATILAHEGAHFIHKHSLKHRRKLKSTSAFAVMIGAGSSAVEISSQYISGFSRDLEREADRYAFSQMMKAGYDIRQTPFAFKKLLADAKANKVERPVFYASHPKLINRIMSYQALIKEHKSRSGLVGKNRYLKNTKLMRVADLKVNLDHGQYNSLILILERKYSNSKYPRYVKYYLGEAYRQRDLKGDKQKSFKAYLQAISSAPNYAPSYRAVGIYYMKKRKFAKASAAFQTFLKLAPNHKDAAYVQQYLQNIRNK